MKNINVSNSFAKGIAIYINITDNWRNKLESLRNIVIWQQINAMLIAIITFILYYVAAWDASC